MAKASVCKFPAPREVDRFLYVKRACCMLNIKTSFRPLSRWIGSYTEDIMLEQEKYKRFRPLSRWIGSYTENKNDKNNCYICFRPLSR